MTSLSFLSTALKCSIDLFQVLYHGLKHITSYAKLKLKFIIIHISDKTNVCEALI